MKLTSNKIAFLLGLLDNRLKHEPDCKQAKEIWNDFLTAFPDLQKMLGLKLRS